MWKKILCFILSLAMLLSMTACNREEEKTGEYQIYYMNMDRSKLVSEGYDSTGAKGEELIEELLTKLQSAPENAKLRQAIPANVKINSFNISNIQLIIFFCFNA